MSSNMHGDESTYIEIIEEGKRLIKEGYLPIHGDFMTGELVIPKKVWLTVEEAKEFEAMIYDFLETFEKQFDVPEWNHYVKLHQLISKRIEQAEKQK